MPDPSIDPPFDNHPKPALAHSDRPQSLSAGGVLVALADGSVRNVAYAISAKTWYQACTPAGQEVLGSDW
jgi:hypothetical protein